LTIKKAAAKVKRWQQIAESAAKQSKRSIIPQISGVMGLEEAFSYLKENGVKYFLMPYENARGVEATREMLKAMKNTPGDAAILIGPEGGFDEREVIAAQNVGFKPLSLGKRILRTETAGMMMLSCIVYEMEP